MKTLIKQFLLVVTFYFITGITAMHSQIVDGNNKLTITLSDDTHVVLFGQAASLSDRKLKNYYYLPFSLRLAQKKDKTPEFLFLKYMTEEKENNGGIGGALLHMLMYWGPTPAQRTELEEILKKGEQGARKGSVLKGALDVKPDGDKSMRIISATLSDSKLARSVVQSFSAPVLEGGRVAVASSLSPHGAQLLAATFEKTSSIADLSIELSYKYTTRMPAAKGRVIINWSEIQKHAEKDSANYNIKTKKKYEWDPKWYNPLRIKTTTHKTRSYDEVRSVIDTLVKKEYIKVEFDENIVDERVTKIREAFFDFFLQQMTNSSDSNDLPPPTAQEKKAMPNIKYGKEYTYNREFIQNGYKKGRQVFNLNYRLAVEKPFTVTANLASWYDGVKNNKKCVASVLLNDPFFQHRDINFILDGEGKDILESGEANYVTFSVKKKRSSGNDFSDHMTIDYAYLKEKGLKSQITYARGDDRNSDNYKYAIQWSLRGGHLFPKEPQFVQGDWMENSLTLVPPVSPRVIEFETDLDELKALGITRATLQLRYYKYGNEVETNIPLTVSKGEPLVEKTIFTDRDAPGYAYRYILSHKERGKMVLDWEAKINDDYVYAIIPEELKDEDPDYLSKVIKAGEVLLKPGKDGKVSKVAGILGKFKDVLKAVTTDDKSK